ncbi:hypothetical protein AB1Y20_019646 [Prymnesium parvum]|uniref:Cilia-and flagella-associated protein 96 n=1 Tax=Prymnesium parvum TaxID=97485 RepID=A0AB34JRN5_PRYPA
MTDSAMKCTLQTFGTFSTPTFAGVGEPYNDSMGADSRARGRQFSTNKSRKGQTGDNWNRGVGRRQTHEILFEGEKYVDPNTYQRKWKIEEAKKNLTPNGFLYSNPNKKSSGLGGYWGCIGKSFEHMPDYDVLLKEQKPQEVQHESRQVITNPPKRGYGYSTPGLAFGPPLRRNEVPRVGKWGGAEYEHSPDPYDMARQYERAERQYNQEQIAGRPPFKSVSHSVDFFDQKKGVAASSVYTEDPRVPERPAPESESKAISAAAFYPARAPKSGHAGTFNKFPPYIEDPFDAKSKRQSEGENAKAMSTTPFKPPQKSKSTPTKSILFHQPGPKLI